MTDIYSFTKLSTLYFFTCQYRNHVHPLGMGANQLPHVNHLLSCGLYHQTMPRERHPTMRPFSSRTDSFGMNTSLRPGTRSATKEDTRNTFPGVGSGSPSTSPYRVVVMGTLNGVPTSVLISSVSTTSIVADTLANLPDGSISRTELSSLIITTVCGVRLTTFVIMIPPF